MEKNPKWGSSMESMRPFRLHSSLLFRRTDEKQVQAARYDLIKKSSAQTQGRGIFNKKPRGHCKVNN